MTLLNNILPEQRRGKLKALLKMGKTVRVLEAHNGLSGIIANNIQVEGESEGKPVIREFDAIWESSLTDSASKGHPDIEVVTFDSRLQTINEILAVTNKPMIVDGDTGGDVNAFEYTVSKLERVGVSAIIIEDKVFPKRNSLEAGVQQNLEDPEIFAQKIRRGKEIQNTDDFMIIARLESLIAGKPMEDAVNRAKTYLRAGVDGIMIHSKSKSSDEIFQFAQHYKEISKQLNLNKTLVCVPTTYNQTTEKELASAGFQIIIHANHLLRSAYKAMLETAQTILRDQRSLEADPLCSTVGEIFKTVGFLDVKEKDQENEQSKNIPVLIPAAGEDPIFKKTLNGKPKAMLEICGKTLLEHQVQTLNNNDLADITVIAGYGRDQMHAEGINILENPDFKNGSMLNSLFVGKKKMNNGFIMLYSDILMEDNIIKDLASRKEDIILVADNSTQYHEPQEGNILDFIIAKNQHKPARREIRFASENVVSKIGSKINPETASHEFIGVARFSKTGAEQLIETYNDIVKNYQGQFQESDDISQLNFTDLIQEMIDRGFLVHFMEIHKGWLEIHNEEHIALAEKSFSE
ncbi:MAG: phosphoenolpyruvate mutase [Nitrospinae bacterium]|nr:phosphoenolpyruvate mutase [Nitrospinota bacterium]MZH05427.1 phosphoenolpyruvate mutase [Nitrospinota bacterium]MZH13295.1 phosphoenolpyruvate mutase [Nitrospinota bacterium]